MFGYMLLVWITIAYIASCNGEACMRTMGSSCTKQCKTVNDCPPDSLCQCDGRCGLSCVKKGLTCKPPPKVRNASFKETGNGFNDVATYTCNSGYTLNGSPKKRCTAEGKWDGVGPTCMQACKQPDLPFGAFVKSTIKPAYKTGDRITLGCKKGFKQSGNPMRICISGRWTAFPFRCKATHTCPRTIRAARTKCTQKCSPQDASECRKNEKCLCDGACGFSCVETGLSCGEPPSIKNGYTQYNSTRYNAVVRYWCKPGFTLDENKLKKCTAKKRWEKPTPNCLPDCKEPRIPNNAYIENPKLKYASGDRVQFKCNKGYNQEGIPSTLCFMGNWNIIPFKCEVGGCGDPGVPENGNKVGIQYGLNSEVFFSCNLGYIRIGSEQRRCLQNNTWSGVQPICKIVDCGKIDPPRNGSIHGNETTFQKSITYVCDKGFELKGSKNAICQSDGKWSVVSKCEAIDCGQPDSPIHGTKKVEESTYTGQVEYSCDPGYYLVGPKTRTCLHTGKWDGIQPICKAVDCGELKPPRNGSVEGNAWTFPNSVKILCDNGFDLLGPRTRRCQTNGKWSGNPTKCRAVDCRQLEVPLNGSLIGKSTTFPAQVEFRCDEGFILKGSKIRKCQANRIWSGKEVRCQAKDCGKPFPIDFGTMYGIGTTYPVVIRYECEDGYILNGPKARQCRSDGKWSGLDPSCEGNSTL